jgi:tetratricopeptide (TPR) repeat protein
MLHFYQFRTFQAIIVMWALLVGPSCEKRSAGSTVQTQGPSLSQLRADYAMRFLEPAPHMALAKYFRDKGNRIQAFYILETARRNRFEESEFNKAFALAFRGSQPPDYSQTAEVALLNEHAHDPNSIQTIVKLADIYISREDWGKAKDYILKAIQLQPADFENTDALARVFRLEGKPEESDRLLREYSQKYPETLDGYLSILWDTMTSEYGGMPLSLSRKKLIDHLTKHLEGC